MSQTREEYIAELRMMDEFTEYRLRATDYQVVEGRPKYRDLVDTFGSWTAAREKAGLNTDHHWCSDKYERPVEERIEWVGNWLARQKKHVGCQVEGCDSEHGDNLLFHHVDPESKDHSVTYYLASGDIEGAKEEVRRCVIVCEGCHTLIHAKFPDMERPEWADDYITA